MRDVKAATVVDSDWIGLIDQRMGGGVFTLGGGAHGRDADRSDRVAGVSAAVICPRPDPAIGEMALGAASLSGAAGRSERPEAMLARGSRVTGSGGAAMPAGSAAPPGRRQAGNEAFGLPCGSSLAFAALADFRPHRFL